jgi:hypothetical protein
MEKHDIEEAMEARNQFLQSFTKASEETFDLETVKREELNSSLDIHSPEFLRQT